MADQGYQNLFVTDTLHQFRPFYDMHRGFDVFHFIRGQERDLFRPHAGLEQEDRRGPYRGPSASHAEDIMLQYLANTMGREREEDWFAPQVFMKGMEFLEAARGDQPFFLVVDNYDPHEPWDPPEKYTSLYDEGYGGQEPWTSSSGPSDWLTERQLQRMRGLYSGEVTMMDTWLGNFLDKMAELNLFENTLLILLSDHGHAFGEHGFAGKVPAALYPELTDITYMIRHPSGKGAGQTSDYFASTHDVAPTVLGALGIEVPPRCRARTSRCCSTAATRAAARTLHGRLPRPRLGPRPGLRHVRHQQWLRTSPLRPAGGPRDEEEHCRVQRRHRKADVQRLPGEGRGRTITLAFQHASGRLVSTFDSLSARFRTLRTSLVSLSATLCR